MASRPVHATERSNYLFSLPGAILGICGLALLLSSVSGVSLGGVTFGSASAIAGSLLFLVGYQAANMGVFATLASDPIQRPNDVVTKTVIERMNLERMSTVGLVVFTAGALYITGALIQWATGAFSDVFWIDWNHPRAHRDGDRCSHRLQRILHERDRRPYLDRVMVACRLSPHSVYSPRFFDTRRR